MTPCEEKGYKVGDRFRQINEDGSPVFNVGEEIILAQDDGSNIPYFKSSRSGRKTFEHLRNVEPITPQWRGPEDGFPPVGSRVNLDHHESDVLVEVEVLTAPIHKDTYEVPIQAPVIGLALTLNSPSPGSVRVGEAFFWHNAKPEDFRPLKSDRDRAIEEMTDIAGASMIGPRAVAEALYKAGYRKTEES